MSWASGSIPVADIGGAITTINGKPGPTPSLALDELGLPTGPVAFNGERATGAGDPVGAQDLVTLAALDAAVTGRTKPYITVGLTTGDFAASDYPSGEACLQAASDALTDGGTIWLLDRIHCGVTGVIFGDYITVIGEIARLDGASIVDDGAGNPLVTTGLFGDYSRLKLYGNGSYGCPLPINDDGSNSNTYTPAYEAGSTYSNTLGSGLRALHARTILDGLWVEGFPEDGIIVQGASSGAPAHAIQTANVKVIGCGGTGVHVNGYGYDGEWVNTWVGSCHIGIVVASGNGECSFLNTHCWGCELDGAQAYAISTRLHGQFESNGHRGIYAAANGVHVAPGSSIWGNGRAAQSAGVEFASASNSTIGLCEVRDNNGDAILCSGTTRGVRGLGVEVNDRLAAFQSTGAAQTYSDGAGSSSVTPTIFATANTPAGIINHSIVIAGAGAAGAALVTRVIAVNPGVSVTLSTPILTTVAAAVFRYAAVTYGVREIDTATGNLFLGCNIPTLEVVNARTSLSAGSFELDFTTAVSLRASLSVAAYTRSTFNNANVVISTGQQYMAQIGTMSASRTATLPAANAVPAGWTVEIVDEAGSVTGVNTIVVTCAGADKIVWGANLTATYTMSTAGACVRLRSNGSSKWVRVSHE